MEIKINPDKSSRCFIITEGSPIPVSLVELHILSEGAAYIHDVWTKPGYEDRGLASKLVSAAIEKAKELGCFKVFLVCSEKHIPFYERLGMKRHQISMIKRFEIV